MRQSGRQSSLGGVPITGICFVRYGKPRPCRTNSLRRPGRFGKGRCCRTNFLLACIWPPKPGFGRIWAGRRFSPLKRPSAGQITLKRTFFGRTSFDRTNTNPSWRPVRETRPCRTNRGDRGGTETPCLPHWTFIPPDLYPAEPLPRDFHAQTGLVRRRPHFCAEPAVSVSGFLFFCHGAQTFPVGLCGAAAFCGTNCVKLWSASAPQSGYYF